MKKNKKNNTKIGKVNPILYAIVYAFFKAKYKKKYNITFDNEIVKDLKGPAIIVATHTCDKDHILSALSLYPVRPTYIVSDHFMRKRSTAKLMKLAHVITKKMFCADLSTIRNVLRAKKENAVIVIFPEGRLSCYGKTLPVTEGTAELIKKLSVDLYAWKAEGAYLTFPKWRDKGDNRCGRIHASVKLLLSADEVSKKSVEEIKTITSEAIYNDDELAMTGVEYKCEDISRGVDKILFKCPNCLKEGTITASEGHIRCKCGLDVTLDSFYRLHNAPFERINEWFDWQQDSIDLDSETLYAKAKLSCCNQDGYMDHEAGEGEIYLDKDVFKLSGTLHGEKIEHTVSTEKLVAFPISPGHHFDIYIDGKLVLASPQPDPKSTVKWVCFLDRLTARRKALEKKS
ncbi:MAG: 1-acyl-sn-glycerol-3-phosphate acyltransferase [Clostridia bacterium]|nr:1-acyl-sn-glycerol-3-phosphate acyltransferase [Clostridia bacterium]